jgi:hypothetical protein
LPDAAFRRSIMLTVSVVQISSVVPRTSPRPVETRRILADLARRPAVAAVFRTPAPGAPESETRVRLGDEITIRGRNFAGVRTWVRLGSLDPIAVVPQMAGERIRITLPDATYPPEADPPGPRPIPAGEKLRAGPLSVQVIVERAMESVAGGRDDRGTPGNATRRSYSDAGVLQLLPEVTAVTPASATAAATIVVQGKRLFASGATTVVVIGDAAIEAQRVVLDPSKPWLPPPDDRVSVRLATLAEILPTPPAGGTDCPVRAIVNGAMSPPLAAGFRLMP